MKHKTFAAIACSLSFLFLGVRPRPVPAAERHWAPVTIVERSGTTLVDYQVKVVLTPESFDYSLLAYPDDGRDIWFVDRDGITPLPHWIETWDRGATSTLWVKLPSLSGSSTRTIYMHYGNRADRASSDPNATLTFYDAVGPVIGTAEIENAETYAELEALTPPVRYPSNPIIRSGGKGWKDSQVQEPIVLPDPDDSNRLVMFFAAMEAPLALGVMAIGRATASASDPHVWTEDPGNPILSPGPPGSWDDYYVRLDSVLRLGDTYFLYYTGQSLDSRRDRIGLATSKDGRTFTKHAANPLLTSEGQGRNDGTDVSQSAVLKEGDTWYLYYAYRGDVTLPGYRYAVSSDGVTWSKAGDGDILSRGEPGTADSTYVEWHQVFKLGDTYVLSYEGYSGTNWGAFLASSPTPTGPFTKSAVNPVFERSGIPGTFDELHVANPSFVRVRNKWYLFYQGSHGPVYSFSNWDMGVADLKSNHVTRSPGGWTARGDTVLHPVRRGSTLKSFTFYVKDPELAPADAPVAGFDVYERNRLIAGVSLLGGRWQHLAESFGDPPRPGTRYKVTIEFPSRTTHRIFIDDVEQTLPTNANASPIVDAPDAIALHPFPTEVGVGYADEIRVREFVDPEPTSTVGSTRRAGWPRRTSR